MSKRFEQLTESKRFPISLWSGPGQKIAGEADVSLGVTGVRLIIDLETDDVDLVTSFIQEVATGPQREEEPVKDPLLDPKSHMHMPVRHEDGKPPWCNVCGLTQSYKKPKHWIRNML